MTKILFPFTKATAIKFGIVFVRGWIEKDGRVLHDGIDFAPTKYLKELACGDEVIEIIAQSTGVCNALVDQNGGKYIDVFGYNGTGYRNVHLNMFLRMNGIVRIGEPIGYMGWTGKVRPKGAAGMHTHVEVLKKGKPIKVELKDFIYLEDLQMQELMEWNDKFYEDGVITQRPSIVSNGGESKLVNVTDNLTEEQLEFMRLTKLRHDFVKNSKTLKNNPWTDRVATRDAENYTVSLDV